FDDVTIYSFLYPVLSEDSVIKARDVWCADDPAKAWQAWMINDETPPAAECDNNPVEAVLDLGRQLRVRGTPAILFADGHRVHGAVPAEKIRVRRNALVKKKKSKGKGPFRPWRRQFLAWLCCRIKRWCQARRPGRQKAGAPCGRRSLNPPPTRLRAH